MPQYINHRETASSKRSSSHKWKLTSRDVINILYRVCRGLTDTVNRHASAHDSHLQQYLQGWRFLILESAHIFLSTLVIVTSPFAPTMQCIRLLTLRMESCAEILWDHIAAAQWVQKDISGMQSEIVNLNIHYDWIVVFICIVTVSVGLKLPDNIGISYIWHYSYSQFGVNCLPFNSTHFIAWSGNEKNKNTCCWTFLQIGFQERTRPRIVAPSAGVKNFRSQQWGVSYRLDCCHLFGGVSQQSP